MAGAFRMLTLLCNGLRQRVASQGGSVGGRWGEKETPPLGVETLSLNALGASAFQRGVDVLPGGLDTGEGEQVADDGVPVGEVWQVRGDEFGHDADAGGRVCSVGFTGSAARPEAVGFVPQDARFDEAYLFAELVMQALEVLRNDTIRDVGDETRIDGAVYR